MSEGKRVEDIDMKEVADALDPVFAGTERMAFALVLVGEKRDGSGDTMKFIGSMAHPQEFADLFQAAIETIAEMKPTSTYKVHEGGSH